METPQRRSFVKGPDDGAAGPMGERQLAGKVAVIVGGGTGIGRAAAVLFARHGARVHVVARTESNLAETCRLVEQAGGSCVYEVGDVSCRDDVERVFRNVERREGRIDVLFNVAGISGRRYGDGPVHELTDEGWDKVMDVNVKGMFMCCRAVLPGMMQRRSGSIINTSSVLGLSPSAEHFGTHAYAASKGAIISMSRAMAAYYAPYGIRVNVVAPGLIRTPMSKRAQSDPRIVGLMKVKQPLTGDLGEAEDVASAALYLAGDGAKFVTGVVLPVDGGWLVSG
jgi:NAD(P)-dependent dehydrogenase (short-subunit alcohol dehydrogenase family)